jgi:CRISPR-associated endonuclease/helicase Cas3
LRASKPVSLASTNAKGFLKEIEKHALSMLDRPGATLAVVVNRVNSARDIHSRLCQAVPGGLHTVYLLTGRMRPWDRDALQQGLLPRIRAGRERSPDDQTIVVVATQSIEAGADFDFDGLVTECASLDALRQRFGRLDRLGLLSGAARGVIVTRSDTLKDDPVYGDAIGKTLAWLQQRAAERSLDFGVEALDAPQDEGLLAPAEHAPILLPSHLDAWVQTAPIPDPDPDIALWLHGPQRAAADIQVVWRADLTEELLNQAVESGDGGTEAEDVVVGVVEALPPVSAEAMSVPFVAARRWLEGGLEPESYDVEGAKSVDDERQDQRPRGPSRPVIIWQGEQSRVVRGDQIKPGQTIVVPSTYGGVEHGNWAPSSRTPVKDVAEAAAWRQGRRPIFRLHESVLRMQFGPKTGVPIPGSSDSEEFDDRDLVLGWLEKLDTSPAEQAVRDLIETLRSESHSLRIERLPVAPGDSEKEYLLIAGRRRVLKSTVDPTAADDHLTTDDSRSFTGATVTLPDHLDGVREMVSRFAERTGVPGEIAADLSLAAEWHDAGKADPRFQRWLHGGSEFKALVQAAPLAKGTARLTGRRAMRLARERAGYPAGCRHELMSVVLMDSAGESLAARAADWVLVRHVVASHHGHCRPLAPWIPDLTPVGVAFNTNGVVSRASSQHDLARLDSGIAEGFWQMVRRYGWWGLAWIEATLRLADHCQSEREQMVGGRRNA